MVKKAKMQKTDSGEFCLFSLCVLLTSCSHPLQCAEKYNRSRLSDGKQAGGVPSVSVSAARAPSRKVECRARQRSYLEQSGGALRAAECPSTRKAQAALSSEGRGVGGGARSQQETRPPKRRHGVSRCVSCDSDSEQGPLSPRA